MIRLLMILASVVLVGGGYAVRFIDNALAPPGTKTVAVQPELPRQPAASGRSITLNADRQGHFRAEARIRGRRIEFLVDTGASLVILRETDAMRAGILTMPGDYTASVATANGKIKAAPTQLDRIEVDGITVHDVPALVLPDHALDVNLLGMSFLSKLRRYEVSKGRMVLEP